VTIDDAADSTAVAEAPAVGDPGSGPDPRSVPDPQAAPEPQRFSSRLAFRTRLTLALIAAALFPLAVLGLGVVLAERLPDPESTIPRLLLLATVIAMLVAIFLSYLLAADLTAPLRAIASAVDRVKSGDLSTRIEVDGDDELARLADSHNRLASALDRRNQELGRILAGIAHGSPQAGADWVVGTAAINARDAFGLIDARVLLVDPSTVPLADRVPGDPLPVRAELRAGDERLGVLVGHLPASRLWDRADQDLLELFAAEVGVSLRNAQLFATVDAQNAQLLELDAAKDDFLRGVSHNLQTPLTSIRAYADQLAAKRPDRRLEIIGEQADRLSRMVRQLLTVTRLESGALKPTPEVLALAPRVRRAWEALAAGDVEFSVEDRSEGWLAVADADQLDQVLWALLDNAVKYGRQAPIDVEIALGPVTGAASGAASTGRAGGVEPRDQASDVDDSGRVRLTIADHGPGVAEVDRSRLFARFARGSAQKAEDGSGLGLYVSRELCRAMDGDLVLEPAAADRGAAFSIWLPAESGHEG
jgi:signal transduction histidine kinase